MAFKERLKEARLNSKMTQEQLGTFIGVAKSTITGYEKGNSEPDMIKTQKIMEVLNVDANYLFQDEFKGTKKMPTPEDADIVLKYMQLNDEGKQYIDTQLDYALTQEKYTKKRNSDTVSNVG